MHHELQTLQEMLLSAYIKLKKHFFKGCNNTCTSSVIMRENCFWNFLMAFNKLYCTSGSLTRHEKKRPRPLIFSCVH